MKRVLIFSVSYHPFVGGAEVAIKEITDRINDVEFDLITLRFDSNLPAFERVGNVNVYRVGFTRKNPTMRDLVSFPLKANKFLFPFLACHKARGLHKERSYDAIWGMMAAYAGFAASFFKKRYPKLPFLLTLQEGDPIDYILKKVRFVRPAFRRIFARADYIQTISSYLADFARSMDYKGAVEVIPNGVDISHFSQSFSEEEIAAARRKIGKRDSDIILIHSGRFVLKNAVDDIIRSLIYLPENVKLLLIGTGPDEEALRQLSEDLNLGTRVVFFGFLDHSDMPIFYQVSDIFIRPSLSEGLGNVFLEAMAAGIPVVATPVGGIPDFLFDPEKNPDHNSTGLFCEVRNPQSIAARVTVLMNDKIKNDEIVKNGSELVRAKYDWSIIADKMRKVLLKI